jgi:uncharacterized protein YbgA (DUF1722 family)/uncharacterized protein YbbK (DUF523 family)
MKKTFSKPNIVVSKCLEFDSCRYNGQMIPDELVRNLKDHVNFIPVCPEVEIGLGTPRKTIRIQKNDEHDSFKLIQPDTGDDLTDKMNQFSEEFIGNLKEIDGFILKNRSPSCAVKEAVVYSEKGKYPFKRPGFFAEKAINKFPELAIEEEGRLKNTRLKEHFLIKIFAFSDFRSFEKNIKSITDLHNFHAKYKLLLMGYNQSAMRKMGKLIAGTNNKEFRSVISEYKEQFYYCFSKLPRINSHVNVLMHAMGYFKSGLKKGEKDHFLTLLDDFTRKKVPLSVNLQIMNSWILRFNNEYLSKQVYFKPFPDELMSEIKEY